MYAKICGTHLMFHHFSFMIGSGSFHSILFASNAQLLCSWSSNISWARSVFADFNAARLLFEDSARSPWPIPLPQTCGECKIELTTVISLWCSSWIPVEHSWWIYCVHIYIGIYLYTDILLVENQWRFFLNMGTPKALVFSFVITFIFKDKYESSNPRPS